MDNQQVELNTADAGQLASLPGVSPRIAKRIVRYRLRHGPFGNISDLQNVRGFAVSQVQQVAERAYVASPSVTGPRVSFGARGGNEAPAAVLSGAPGYLQGEVELANAGAQEIRMVEIQVENAEVCDRAGRSLTQIRLRARLAPGGQAKIPVTIALDSRTAPGVYKADVVIGEERRSVIFNVAELTAVQIVPDRLVFLNERGARVEKQLFVTNTGNVPLRGGGVVSVAIEEENFQCRVTRNTVRRLSNPSLDDFVGAASDELKSLFDEVELLRIRTKSKPDEILPGETGTFVLDFQLPLSMRKGRYYSGRLRLFDASVGIVINPGPSENGNEDISEPAL